MKILVCGINYSPELTGVGKYTGEMVSWLVAAGHDVRVITAPPHYPQWKVHEGFTGARYTKHVDVRLHVTRVPIWIPHRLSAVRRALHLALFAVACVPPLVAAIRWRPDVVWTVEPTLFVAPLVLLYSRTTKSKSWLHVQDFEFDVAFSLGVVKSPRFKRFFERVESAIVSRFDQVSTISNRMIERLHNKGVESEKRFLFQNWVDTSAIIPLQRESKFREILKIDKSKIVALYSGNMGGKQGLEILGEVALLLKGNPLIEFVFCGSGPARAELEQACSTLSNVKFLDLQPFELLNEVLGLADIHLLPQRAGAEDLVMPSKLTGMLASGRPVVAAASPGSELELTVNNYAQCGVTVLPEDPEQMAGAVLRLAQDSEERRIMGENGRRYSVMKINKDVILEQFQRKLEVMIRG